MNLFFNRYVFAVLFNNIFIQHMDRGCKCGRVFVDEQREKTEEEKNTHKQIGLALVALMIEKKHI